MSGNPSDGNTGHDGYGDFDRRKSQTALVSLATVVELLEGATQFPVPEILDALSEAMEREGPFAFYDCRGDSLADRMTNLDSPEAYGDFVDSFVGASWWRYKHDPELYSQLRDKWATIGIPTDGAHDLCATALHILGDAPGQSLHLENLIAAVPRVRQEKQHQAKGKDALEAADDTSDRPAEIVGPSCRKAPRAAGRWPWGEHETELLRHLLAAATKFWVNFDPGDPTTAPTNETVTEYLTKRGVSSRVAETMAQILRADGLRPGPRPLAQKKAQGTS